MRFWKKWLPCDGATRKSRKPDSTITRAPGDLVPRDRNAKPGIGRSPAADADQQIRPVVGAQLGIEVRHRSARLHGCVAARSDASRRRLRRAHPARVRVPARRSFGRRASADRLHPGEYLRLHAKAPAAAAAGSQSPPAAPSACGRRTANSISTGRPSACFADASSADPVSAATEIVHASGWAQSSQCVPRPAESVVDRVVVHGVGGGQHLQCAVALRHVQSERNLAQATQRIGGFCRCGPVPTPRSRSASSPAHLPPTRIAPGAADGAG